MQPLLQIGVALMPDGQIGLQLQQKSITVLDKAALIGLLHGAMMAVASLPTADVSPIALANGPLPPLGGRRG